MQGQVLCPLLKHGHIKIFLITGSALKVEVESQHHLLQWPTYACAYSANGKEALQIAA